MAKKKEDQAPEAETKVGDKAEAVADQTPAVEQPAAPSKKGSAPIVVKYRDHQGVPTERTFSPDVHGENFADLAAEFKATNADKLIA